MRQQKKYITASRLIQFASCSHAYFLDAAGDPSLKRKESDAEKLMREEGIAFQSEALRRFGIEESGVSHAPLEEGFETTLGWMNAGSRTISQGVLLNGNYAGIPDILIRVPGRSNLGDYTYAPIEIKNRTSVTSYDRLQLSFYAMLLEPVLGYRPESGSVLSPDGELKEVLFSPKLTRQLSEFLRHMNLVDSKRLATAPLRCSSCPRCFWSEHCTSLWKETDHVSLLSGVSVAMARKLEAAGITTCAQVASALAGELASLLRIPSKLSRRFVSAAQSRTWNRPIVLKEPSFCGTEPVYFYDIETCDDVVFCHGLVRVENGVKEERCFFADSPEGEKKSWHELLESMAENESSRVYCWTFYEKYFIDRLWRKYGGSKRGFENLRNNLTDQCAFVREHFALPCRGYSIKAVAPYFGFRWQADDPSGMNCIAWYREWMAGGEPSLKETIQQYNLDDVRAMVLIDEKLRAFCSGRNETNENLKISG